jgi:hypothetical protein
MSIFKQAQPGDDFHIGRDPEAETFLNQFAN